MALTSMPVLKSTIISMTKGAHKPASYAEFLKLNELNAWWQPPTGCRCTLCQEAKQILRMEEARSPEVVDTVPGNKIKKVHSSAASAVTQKIRGLYAAPLVEAFTHANSQHSHLWRYAKAKDLLALGVEGTRALLDGEFNGAQTMFIRPCPVTPRHGFVDSYAVPVKNLAEELIKTARKTVAVDPEAEIMITTYINAEANAVLTPTTFALGHGHDGATSGQSFAVFGPAPDPNYIAQITNRASIADGDEPYVELVWDKVQNWTSGGYIVQVRGGPVQVTARDYVPARVDKVKTVLTATHDTDLLAWEKLIANAEPGTVVYAPGLSLSAHAAVHAVMHQIPVLTTYAPAIGEAVEEIPAPVWTEDDYARLAKYIDEAEAHFANAGGVWQLNEAVLGVIALHTAAAQVEATDAQLRLLAYGSTLAAKAIAAASIGEARHTTHVTERFGDKRDFRGTPVHGVFQAAEDATREKRAAEQGVRPRYARVRLNRNILYKRAFEASFDALERALYALVPLYRDRSWGGNAYGGPKWGAINAGARNMITALLRFKRLPTQKRWAKVVSHWNEAINREHNGGAPALQKFGVSNNNMDNAARWPIGQLAGVQFSLLSAIFFGTSADVQFDLLKPAVTRIAKASRRISPRYIHATATLAALLGVGTPVIPPRAVRHPVEVKFLLDGTVFKIEGGDSINIGLING